MRNAYEDALSKRKQRNGWKRISDSVMRPCARLETGWYFGHNFFGFDQFSVIFPTKNFNSINFHWNWRKTLKYFWIYSEIFQYSFQRQGCCERFIAISHDAVNVYNQLQNIKIHTHTHILARIEQKKTYQIYSRSY